MLLGVSAVVALILAETVLRIGFPRFGPARGDMADPFWQPDARLGWVHRPETEGRFVAPGFDVAVRINSHGLRGPEYEAGPGRPRILLMGDSFAWGWGVEEHQTLAGRLGEGLPGWDVLNAATAGYSTDQQLLWYIDERARFEAELVVLLFCENDFSGNARTVMYGFPKPLFVFEDEALRLTNVPVPELSRRKRIRS